MQKVESHFLTFGVLWKQQNFLNSCHYNISQPGLAPVQCSVAVYKHCTSPSSNAIWRQSPEELQKFVYFLLEKETSGSGNIEKWNIYNIHKQKNLFNCIYVEINAVSIALVRYTHGQGRECVLSERTGNTNWAYRLSEFLQMNGKTKSIFIYL